MVKSLFLLLPSVCFTCILSAGVILGSTCKKPIVRKEWRSLGYDGQKAYTDAIKVDRRWQTSSGPFNWPSTQCLSNLPHNASLTPTGATPGIQPVISNSSRYDDVVYTWVKFSYLCVQVASRYWLLALLRHMDATDRQETSSSTCLLILTNLGSAHFTGRFLPWHRLYIHTMENLLRNECNYKGYMTYWDWTLGNFLNSFS